MLDSMSKKVRLAVIVLFHMSMIFGEMKAQPKVTATVSSYEPPAFNEADRLNKIASAFPLIEKLYKVYAEKNNLPGLAFGVVVDGKLVFSGSKGFTNISNKTSATTASTF